MKINDRKKMKRKKMGSFGAYKSFVVCGKEVISLLVKCQNF